MGTIFRRVDSFLKLPTDNRGLTAVVPTEVVERHERSVPGPDVGDFSEDHAVVPLIQHLKEVALDPAGAVHEDGQARSEGWVFTFSKEPSITLSARSCIPSWRNETANPFCRWTFARVRLSFRNANATSGGLKDVCMSHVPNISQSFPSSVRVPTMYAPYGISCRTFFFTFLSIAPPAATNAPVPNQIMRCWSGRGPVDAPFGVEATSNLRFDQGPASL